LRRVIRIDMVRGGDQYEALVRGEAETLGWSAVAVGDVEDLGHHPRGEGRRIEDDDTIRLGGGEDAIAAITVGVLAVIRHDDQMGSSRGPVPEGTGQEQGQGRCRPRSIVHGSVSSRIGTLIDAVGAGRNAQGRRASPWRPPSHSPYASGGTSAHGAMVCTP